MVIAWKKSFVNLFKIKVPVFFVIDYVKIYKQSKNTPSYETFRTDESHRT